MVRDYPRSARIASQIQEVVSEALIKKIKDPRLADASITEVRMSSDLSYAYIYFSISFPSPKKVKDAEKAFYKAKGFFKKNLGQSLNLRYIPELKFEYDTVLENGQKIDQLLKSLKEKEHWSDDDGEGSY